MTDAALHLRVEMLEAELKKLDLRHKEFLQTMEKHNHKLTSLARSVYCLIEVVEQATQKIMDSRGDENYE